jgi:hypothetical protein
MIFFTPPASPPSPVPIVRPIPIPTPAPAPTTDSSSGSQTWDSKMLERLRRRQQ